MNSENPKTGTMINALLSMVAGAVAGSACLFLAAEMFSTYSGQIIYAHDHLVEILTVGAVLGALTGCAGLILIGNRSMSQRSRRIMVGLLIGIGFGPLTSKAYVELAVPSTLSEASAKIRAAKYRSILFCAIPICATIGGFIGFAIRRKNLETEKGSETNGTRVSENA